MQIITCERSKGERPILNARKTVRWPRLTIVTCSKPGKGNRNTTSNCLAGRKVALAAHEDRRLLPLRLPRRNVRTLQIDRRGSMRCSDACVDKAIGSSAKGKNARESEVFVELSKVQ